VLYAESKEKFDAAAAAILGKRAQHSKFVTRFEKFLERKSEWAVYERAEGRLRGNDTNNYAEVSMKIMKEVNARLSGNLIMYFNPLNL
jgi:hypothetical protein